MEKTNPTTNTVNNNISHFDENRWLDRVRRSFCTELEEGLGVSVAVFDVPKLLRAIKPEAYVPQHFAIGPYHQKRPELRDMERYKIHAAKKAESSFKDFKFDHLVEQFLKLDNKIRAPYHRFLDFNEETLAWMMAIDTCFLLEFLQKYQIEDGTGLVPPPTNWMNDANTEIILRNLVAYEASVAKGPLVLARYTELMNGIIDTVEDVKILRKSGIILNHMKSDREVADLWNGMSRSIRLTRVPKIDQVIDNVKNFNNRKLKVKADKFLKKYVFRSWRILTLLATLILLVMTGLQTKHFPLAIADKRIW
ncbi:hypothetical protein LUZ60_002990 [Juncus effusus]|nr:hypothetical protein LUZ60_002990 [Juncus effusus]